ncbi:MAG: beta-1,6-N-acetylglucosaminyltransferase [Gordonia sp. (in: high G+C Gram-positive bacteria)]
MTAPRFAVHIMAHTEPHLFGDLVASLAHERIDVYAHIDAKVDERPFAEAAAGGARFVAPRVRVNWGGFSQVRATVESLATARDGYQRHSLLSGADVLLRPLDEVVEAWSTDDELIRIDQPLNDPAYSHWTKVDRYHFPDHPRLRIASARLRRRVPDTRPLVQGSTWWSLTGAAVRHLRERLATERDWVEFFRYSLCPDEYVFHSLLSDSPFAAAIRGGDGPNVHGQHYIEWPSDGWHPRTLTEDDLPRALDSGALFARKVGPRWTWRGVLT